MFYKLAVTRNIGSNQRPRHCRTLQQRSRQSFAIGWQHDSRRAGNMRPDIFGIAEVLNQLVVDPLTKLVRTNSGAIARIDIPQQLEPPARLFNSNSARRVGKFTNTFVAEQPADEQEG